jgi:acetolactate synthase-1/3 small subunit
MRHVLSATVRNVPGVLVHISGMLASRGHNIDSLVFGATENPGLSRMTFVVSGNDNALKRASQQLQKIVTVVDVLDISSQDHVERDLMLLKVSVPHGCPRSEVRELVDIFRGRIIDFSLSEALIEIPGQQRTIEAFIKFMRPFGIKESVRTGRIVLVPCGGRSNGSETLSADSSLVA